MSFSIGYIIVGLLFLVASIYPLYLAIIGKRRAGTGSLAAIFIATGLYQIYKGVSGLADESNRDTSIF